MLKSTEYNNLVKLYHGKRTIILRGVRKSDGSSVIIKRPESLNNNMPAQCRLEHEYKMNQSIDSSRIVKIYGTDYIGGVPVLVMEDFNGFSLREATKKLKLKLKDFLILAIGISESLNDIHRHGIIHNDLNPGNIIVSKDFSTVKISDFCISSTLTKEGRALEGASGMTGTIQYISPEQTGRINRKIDQRTDFYSLGVTLYELLTGQLPFNAEDGMGIVHSHLAKSPIPPDKVNTAVPSAVSAIIMKLMEKTAEDRYQTAKGIINDLTECLKQLRETGKIEYFNIGANDISNRFNISQKLYGREKEKGILLSAFERVCNNSREVMLVTGYSGIGKSSLINEIAKPVTQRDAYFITGKFDQFQFDAPYSAIIEAFKGLIRNILTLNEEQINGWKGKILDAVGTIGRIIIDVIPEVEMIIGKQPGIPELLPEETKNRFNHVFQKFVSTFCSKDHPLVLFLDDLQWADLSSLKLIEVFIGNSKINHFLLIGAYRDNEVHDMHPLMFSVNNMQKEDIPVNSIFLGPLDRKDIKRLIYESLSCSMDEADELAEIVAAKTGGNPFFLSQFLYMLYGNGFIKFNYDLMKWGWNTHSIRNARITDNVVELIKGKIEKLSQNVRELLKMAACIGNKFDVDTLAIILKRHTAEISDDIRTALQEEIIFVHPKGYAFVHDRIQQAAYLLIDEGLQKNTHLTIGRLLLADMDEQETEEKILDIVNHLNQGIELIVDKSEKVKAAGMELTAGRKAIRSTAYEAGYRYLSTGLSLVEDFGWDEEYDLTFELTYEASKAAFLNGDSGQMEYYAEVILRKGKTNLHKVKAYEVKCWACSAQGRYREAVNSGLKGFELLNAHFPLNPNKLHVGIALVKLMLKLSRWKDNEILELPIMSDPAALAYCEINRHMGFSTFNISKNLVLLIVFKQIENSLKHGNALCGASATYTILGYMFSSLGMIKKACKYGKLSMELSERSGLRENLTFVRAMYFPLISYWEMPYEKSIRHALETYSIALENGNYDYLCLTLATYCNGLLLIGKNLNFIIEEMNKYTKIVIGTKSREFLYLQLVGHQAALNLSGQAETPGIVDGEVYKRDSMLPIQKKEKDMLSMGYLYIYELLISYLLRNFKEAENNTVLVYQNMEGMLGTIAVQYECFLTTLTMIESTGRISGVKKQLVLQKINNNRKKLKKWAVISPENFMQLYTLVEAETASIKKDCRKAAYYYEETIRLAIQNKHMLIEAMAYESAARFHFSQGSKKTAGYFLRDAYKCYKKWGAVAKLRQLEEEFAELKGQDAALNAKEPIGSSLSMSGSLLNENMDLMTVVKASQTISGEIVLENLLKKLVEIVLENSGAQRVVLLLKRNHEFFVEAAGKMEKSMDISVLQSEPADGTKDIPQKVINYVIRTKKTVILEDASKTDRFVNDAYIKNNSLKSVLCMPISRKGELTGLLYLENSFVDGAFSQERINILNILSSQLAISIENAMFYSQLDDAVNKRTMELSNALEDLKKTQNYLVESEKLAALGQLVAGVAHEINTPLGIVRASASNILSYLDIIFKKLPEMNNNLTKRQQKAFFGIVARAVQSNVHISLKDERIQRKNLNGYLQKIGLDKADELTEVFASMGIYDSIDGYLDILIDGNCIEILHFAFMLSGLYRNSRNINEAVERASKMVFALKNYSRYGHSGEFVLTDIRNNIENVLTLYYNHIKNGVEVVRNYSEVSPVMCNPDELTQVWTNLIHNALQSMDYKGRLEIDIYEESKFVNVDITDSGKGIPDEIKHRIFEPFFTTKPQGEGTGLGLDIVKKIISNHQGNISFDSIPGKTTFKIRLPL